MNIEMIPFLFVGVGIFTYCIVRYNLMKFLYASVGIFLIYFAVFGWDGFLNADQMLLGKYGILQAIMGALIGAITGFQQLDKSLNKEEK